MRLIAQVSATLLAVALWCLASLAASAATYPLTVTDFAGRKVTIAVEPQRIALQDGRDSMMLALLDRDNPFRRVVIWNNLLARQDAPTWQVMLKKWPEAAKIPDMGFSDDGEVNPEDLVASRPQLVIAEARALPSLRDAGVIDRLAALNIPLLFVDTFSKPVPDAQQSVELLGQVLNKESEAAAYNDFYAAHLKHLTDTIAGEKTRPRIFVEALAGSQGPEQCCFTHGSIGWGALVQAIGAENIGSKLVPGASGDVTLETVLAAQPDVYVFSGRQSGAKATAMVPLGYGANPANVAAAMQRLEARPGFPALKAAQDGRVYALWHLFYSHPYNIVALEWLAKMAYPQALADLDPAKTWNEIIAQFTEIPQAPSILEAQAPALGDK
ncbi:MAG TPA: ABC transporter substrate-binding protein [Devosiaceae bacterium]|nr:ABC transporter substrate-binding protein [Devosiaceae bacterium]